MKKERKEQLIDILLDQQTIVINSTSEVDFRRAEVTSQLINAIVQIDNLPESLQLIGGLDSATLTVHKSGSYEPSGFAKLEEIQEQSDGVVVREIKESKSLLLGADNKYNGRSKSRTIELVKQRIFRDIVTDLLRENCKYLTQKEIMELIDYKGDSKSFSAKMAAIDKHFVKISALKRVGDRSRFCYGLKEWVEKKEDVKIESVEKEQEPKQKRHRRTKAQMEASRLDSNAKPLKEKKEKKEVKEENSLRKKHLKNTGRKTNDNLTYKIEANDPNLRLKVNVGDSVKFKNVLGTLTTGNIVAMNIPGKESYKGEFHNKKTVTIEEGGSLYDRQLDQIIKLK